MLLVGLTTGIAFCVGRRLLRALGVTPATPAEEIAFSAGLGCGVIAYAVFAAGLAGVLDPWVFAVILAAGAVLGAREARAGIAAARGIIAQTQTGLPSLNLVIGVLILVCAAANLLGSLAPPAGGDALAYHLAIPKIWLADHRLTEIPWRWPSYGPFAMQMLFMLGLGLGGLTAPSLLAWVVGLLTAIALIGASAQFLRGFPPLLAAGVFYTMSTVGQGSASTRVDLALTLYVTLAVLACLSYLRTRQVSWLAVAGLCAGIAAGTKYPGATAAALLAIGLVIFGERRLPGAGWRAAGRFAALAAAVAAPWYVRSALLTGDPAYPFFTALLHGGGFRDQLSDLATRYGPGKSAVDLLTVPFYVTASVGAPYLSFAPFSLAWRRTIDVRFLWYIVATLTIVWFFTAQVIRFLLPALPPAAVLAALGFAALQDRSRALALAARVAVIAGLGIASAITLYHAVPFMPVAVGRETREAFLLRKTDTYADIAWMNTHLPADARVLFLARTAFYLDRAYVGAGTRASAGVLTAQARVSRISHIYCEGDRCDAVSGMSLPVHVIHTGSIQVAGPHDRPARSIVTRVFEVRSD